MAEQEEELTVYEEAKKEFIADSRKGHPNFEHARLVELLDVLENKIQDQLDEIEDRVETLEGETG